MCGILYAKLKHPNQTFSTIFKEALALMAYRGQDNISDLQYKNDYFGHARLSILDLTSRSNQPVVTTNEILLFKGEIYNYKQLVPHAPSDTLAIAELIEFGTDISNKLNGMYAILKYDKHTNDVSVLRDFYGEKPVYYYCDNQICIISSTIKPIVYILEKTFKKVLALSHLSLYEYMLCGYVREPKTIYEDILMLEPGHQLHFSQQFWQIQVDNKFNNILSNTVLDSNTHIKNCLQTSDVIPALLLSSGVDSTYLLSHINNARDDYEILTYRADSAAYDESETALKNLHTISKGKTVKINVIKNHEHILNLYDQYPQLLEQPSSDGMNLFNLLSLYRREGEQKLVIIGTGGDELYGGYHSFKNYRRISLFRNHYYLQKLFPAKYRRFFTRLPRQYTVEAYYFLYRICPQMLPHVPKDIVKQLFTDFVTDMQRFKSQHLTDPYQKIKIFETFDYMRNQLLRDADNISLYCGFEARNPLLSITAYRDKPDNKAYLKNTIKQRHGISFDHKKGFTLCAQDDRTTNYLIEKILTYNAIYPIFPSKLIEHLSSGNFSEFYVIRKIFILLSWLNNNKITNQQLQNFRVDIV